MTTNKKRTIPQKKKAVIRRAVEVTVVGIFVMMFGIPAAGCQQTEQIPVKPSIEVGTWVDSHKIAEKDGIPHPMQYRIDSITRDQEVVASAISEYNLSGTGNVIGQIQNDNLEFCMAEYSATFPADFPQSVFGITDVAIPFEIVSMTGGTIQVDNTIYQNLATTWEIGDLPQGYDFHSGDTYQGRIIFIMVKGYSEYLIHEIKTDAGETGEAYIKGI